MHCMTTPAWWQPQAASQMNINEQCSKPLLVDDYGGLSMIMLPNMLGSTIINVGNPFEPTSDRGMTQGLEQMLPGELNI